MSWINLCATRHRLLSEAVADSFEDGEEFDSPHIVVPLILRCVLVGDQTLLDRNIKPILSAYRSWENKLVSGDQKPTNILVLQQALSLSILLESAGYEDRGMQDWAGTWTFSDGEEDQILNRLVKAMREDLTLDGTDRDKHVANWLEFLSVGQSASITSLFDLIMCPGHDQWHNLMFYAAPAAAAIARQREISVQKLMFSGTADSKSANVIFERARPVGTEKTRGFDAVVDTKNGPVGCYDFSMTDEVVSQSKLIEVFQSVDQDWEEAGVTGTQIQVYFDPRRERVSTSDVAAAADATGIDASLLNFLDQSR